MTVDPKTAAYIMGVFTLLGIAGQTPLPSWISPSIGMDVQSTCAYLAVLGNGVATALHLLSSAKAGPMA